MTPTTNAQNKRMVQDTKGSSYELRGEMSRGGQGIVYRTQYPQVLIKGFTNKDQRARLRWHQHIAWLIRQDLSDLKLARPLTLLAEPRFGYVMELMDGLVPLQSLFDSFITAEDEAAADYVRQGGLRRRIRILSQLARTLNQLHSRGMLYGDLSPSNIFVSDDPGHAETWLIDCDNISLESHSGLTVHTADYGAPEVVRSDSLLSSLTDIWSFAVIAYQLLTHNHPFKGELISDGDPEEEEAALRGERPWIYDTQDDSNQCFTNLPIQLIEHSKLPALFSRCFEQGLHNPSSRPSMAEWLEAFTEIDERIYCCASCGGSTLLSAELGSISEASCFFCDEPTDSRLVLFEEFISLPAETEGSTNASGEMIATGRMVWLQPGVEIELKRLMPTFSYDRWPSDHVRIEYNAQGLGIHPLPRSKLHISRGAVKKPIERYQGLKESLRGQHEEPYWIYIGEPEKSNLDAVALGKSYVIWQFRW
ncbi:protein kinase domain-containing protein [Pseudomonas sp. N040]|uniref:protein kinase domain-containing protein n=1 Tax=Pseudomonas sp. N040 TaxID=2785325 RepID=UPI0018A302E7|nr:protein kinase [Pseudomonas sp. N040]MBF7728603.1 protein kinase [Pseudomonas sp. N040]MBW7012243.1 protein kinase [Pseudomonas sp. N040]